MFYPDKLSNTGLVLVLEGEADTLAALTAGAKAVVGTAGSSPGKYGRVALQKLLAGRECILFPHPDANCRPTEDSTGIRTLRLSARDCPRDPDA